MHKAGFEVLVEKGAGTAANYSDSEYTDAGASIGSRKEVMSCDIVISIRLPDTSELSKGQIVACVADPFRHPDKVQACIDGGITLMSMDMIPRRLSRAQSMDKFQPRQPSRLQSSFTRCSTGTKRYSNDDYICWNS